MLKSMIISGHNFALVTTAQLSWHVQNFNMTGSLESKWEYEYFSQDFDYKLLNP